MNTVTIDGQEYVKKSESVNVVAVDSEIPAHPYKVGKNYLVRSVNFTNVGKLVAVYENELVLSDASWVADTGRFNEALKDGIESLDSSEIEPYYGDVVIGRGSVGDCVEYKHDLPSRVK